MCKFDKTTFMSVKNVFFMKEKKRVDITDGLNDD